MNRFMKSTITAAALALGFSAGAYDYSDRMEPSTTNPGGFSASEVPQLIVIGSDDNTDAEALRWMLNELASRTNPDGSALRMSFYSNTSDWDKNSELVEAHKEAYAAKHEIGNHTVDHIYCIEHDGDGNVTKKWTTEELQNDQIQPVWDALVNQVGVNPDHIYGFRTPFLGFSNNTFSAMENVGHVYDCSIGEGGQYADEEGGTIGEFFWPYTLDYDADGDGNYAPGLPNWWTGTKNDVTVGQHSGLWELPAYNFKAPSDVEEYMDSQKEWATGGEIGGLDYNMWAPLDGGGWELDKDQSLRTLKNTLDKMYNGNRTPFTLGAHSQMYVGEKSKFPNIPAEADRKAMFTEFLDYALTLDNVWFVSGAQAINYCRQPVKASEFDPDDYLPENFLATENIYVNLDNKSVMEGSADAVVGVVGVTNSDNATLSITAGSDNFKISGDTLYTAAALAAGTLEVTIKAVDGDLTAEKTFTITVEAEQNTDPLDAPNIAGYAGWEGIADEIGSTVDVTLDSTDDVVTGVTGVINRVAATNDTSWDAWASLNGYFDTTTADFGTVTATEVTYSSTAEFKYLLPTKKTGMDGTAHFVTLPNTDGADTTITIRDINGTFKQPSWLEEKSDIVLADVTEVSFELADGSVDAAEGSISISSLKLKGLDVDGSSVIIGSATTDITGLAVNSVSADALSIATGKSGTYAINLYSVNGRKLAGFNSKLTAGINRVPLSGAALTGNVFILQVKGADMNMVKRIMVR